MVKFLKKYLPWAMIAFLVFNIVAEWLGVPFLSVQLVNVLAIIGWMHQRPHIPRDMLLKAIKPVLQQVDDTLALTS